MVKAVSTHIVLVAGLYSPAIVLLPLANRLRRKGHAVSVFSRHYPIRGGTTAATQLLQHLRSVEADELHLVAHSYGGIVLLRLFEQLEQAANSDFRLERIQSSVFIASPLAGARLARQLVEGRAGFIWKHILGKSLQQGLDGGHSPAELPANSGFITGDRKSLLSKLLQRDAEVGDGLVRLSETLASDLPETRHISLPLTHAGLLFSRRCCGLIDDFVRLGRFSRGKS